MKNFKKLFLLVICFICLFTCFACDKITENPTEGEQTPGEQTPEVQTPEELDETNTKEVIKNALEKLSFDNYKNFSLNINNFKMKYHDAYNNTEYDYNIDIEEVNMNVQLDENNKLIANGKGVIKYSENNSNQDILVEIHVADGFVYLMQENTIDGGFAEKNYAKLCIKDYIIDNLEADADRLEGSYDTSLDNIFKYYANQLGITSFESLEEFLNAIKGWYEESFSKIIDNINKNSNLDLTKVITDVLYTFLDVSKTADGYQIKLKEIEFDIEDLTVYDLLVSIVGENLLTNIDLVLDFNVDKLIKFAESKGLVLKDLIESIDSLLQVIYNDSTITLSLLLGQALDEEDFDLLEFLNSDEIRSISVSSLVESYFGYTKEEVKVLIADYLNQFKDMKLKDIIGPYMNEEVTGLIETLKPDTTIYLNNDFLIDNVTYKLNIDADESLIPIKLIGEIQLQFNNQELLDTSALKTSVDAFMIKYKKNIDYKALLQSNYEEYEIVEENGKIILTKENDGWTSQEYDNDIDSYVNVYHGWSYVKEYYMNDLKSFHNIFYTLDCNGNYYLYFAVPYYTSQRDQNIYQSTIVDDYSTFVDESLAGKVYSESIYGSYYLDNVYSYFNPTTGKYTYNDDFSTLHDWVEVESKSYYTDKCLEYDKVYYLCNNCGEHQISYESKNKHDVYDAEYELYGTSCDEGGVVTIKCKHCPEYSYTKEFDWHYYSIQETYNLKDYGYKLDDVISYEQCLCGYEKYLYLPYFNKYTMKEKIVEIDGEPGSYKEIVEYIYLDNEGNVVFNYVRDENTYYFGNVSIDDYKNADLILKSNW